MERTTRGRAQQRHRWVFEAVDTSDLERDVVGSPYSGEVTPEGDHVDDGIPFHVEGEVIGHLVGLEGTTVFPPSDTDFLDHHESVTAGVFVPPIGGHFTMGRSEAADFARSVEADLVLPEHYDTFEAIETDVEALADDLEVDGIRVEPF